MNLRTHAFVAAVLLAFVPPQLRAQADLSRSELRDGGIVRGRTDAKRLALVFTAHSYAEGGPLILDELELHHAKASFFITGVFLANTNFTPLVRRMVSEGHYVGPHSDQHLLYCSWDQNHRTLVSHDAFRRDLLDNVDKLVAAKVPRAQIRFFLPAFEHFNQQIADWTKACGLTLIDFTPGTRSTADYTGERDANFVSSQAIYDSIISREHYDPHGLNGFLLLFHLGAGPGRTDKFHPKFGRLLDYLQEHGYQFVRIDQLLEN